MEFAFNSMLTRSSGKISFNILAKGFTQTYKTDYHEAFAPMAKIQSIRILLSLPVNSNYPLNQLDI